MTPARIAVATARTQTSSSDPSSIPPPSHSPSMRQISLGRKPASTSTSRACPSPIKLLIALPPSMDAISNRAGGYTADQDIHSGMQQRNKRKQREPERQGGNIGNLPAVAGSGEQECQRRQQQNCRAQQG